MSFFKRAGHHAKQTARNVMLLLIGAFLAVLLFGGAGLYYFREPLIKATVIPRISKVTGFKTEAQTLRHEFPLRLTLSNVTMLNPKGYKPKTFATAPYFYIDIDLWELLKGDIFYIHEWKIIMSTLHLERDKEGVINGMLLKSIKNFMSGKTPQEGASLSAPDPMDLRLDRLELRINNISYRDRTGVVPRKSLKKLKLGTHVYENVEEFRLLIDQIEYDVLDEMQLGKRMELSPFYIERSLKKAADTVKDTTEKFAEGAGKVVKTTTVTGPAEIFKTTAGIMGIRKETKIEKRERQKKEAAPLLATPAPVDMALAASHTNTDTTQSSQNAESSVS